jgi:hypothetical protein
VSYDSDRDGSWNFDAAYARDFEKESSPLGRVPRQLDVRGSVRISYVCPEEVHQQMKLDGRFDALPGLKRREFIVVDFEDGSPLELHRYANCSCNSTIVKVIDTSDAPTWTESLRKAGV